MASNIQFAGTVQSVLSDRRSAVVRLDMPSPSGMDYAVVNTQTIGREPLLNGIGRIDVGTKVAGEGHDGPEAIIADLIRVVDEHE